MQERKGAPECAKIMTGGKMSAVANRYTSYAKVCLRQCFHVIMNKQCEQLVVNF